MDPRTSLVSRVTDTSSDRLVVMKFGGSSVSSPERIRKVVEIIRAKKRVADPIVVVSAVGGVTDRLVEALEGLEADDFDPEPLLRSLRTAHENIASTVLSETHAREYGVSLDRELDELREELVSARGSAISSRVRDRMLSVGERLSAPLLSRALASEGCRASAYNTASLITTNRSNGDVNVDMIQTHSALQRWHALRDRQIVPVLTGFLGGTPDGETTTLGRGGSDYSAAIVARALQANILERWTDVDGLYTEDPRKNGRAEHLRRLTFEEALERTHRGTFGMHPRTLDPLMDTSTEVHVRGTLTPEAPGTIITPQ
jgi:aspartate kinase